MYYFIAVSLFVLFLVKPDPLTLIMIPVVLAITYLLDPKKDPDWP